MKLPVELTITVEIDDWEVEALKWAYHHLGLTTEREPDKAQLEAILLDMWTGLLAEQKQTVLDNLTYAVRAGVEQPLCEKQLYLAKRIEEAWLDATPLARREALIRLGAWQTNAGRFWTLSVMSPQLLERLK